MRARSINLGSDCVQSVLFVYSGDTGPAKCTRLLLARKGFDDELSVIRKEEQLAGLGVCGHHPGHP